MHTGCPVIKGIKWGAPLWVHTDEFRPAEFKAALQKRPPADRDPGKCEDLHTTCKMWAESGECRGCGRSGGVAVPPGCQLNLRYRTPTPL